MNYRRFIASIALASFTLPVALAEAFDDSAVIAVQVVTVSGTTTTAVALAGMGTYASSSQGRDNQRRGVAAMLYLRQHAAQVREELTMGRGPMLAALASELRVAPQRVAAFTRRVRTDRQQLLALAESAGLTPQRALTFFAHIEHLAFQSNG